MLRLNVKLSEVLLLRLRATFHTSLYVICERKFYARHARKNYATVEINPQGINSKFTAILKHSTKVRGGALKTGRPFEQ